MTAKNITPQPDIYGYMYVSAKAMAAFPFTEMLVKASSDADLTQVRAEIMNTCPTALIVDKDLSFSSGKVMIQALLEKSACSAVCPTCSRCWFSRSRR